MQRACGRHCAQDTIFQLQIPFDKNVDAVAANSCVHSRNTSEFIWCSKCESISFRIRRFHFAGEGGQFEQSFGPDDAERNNNVGDVKQFDHRCYVQHTCGGLHTCRCRTIFAAGTFPNTFFSTAHFIASARARVAVRKCIKYFMKSNVKLICDVFWDGIYSSWFPVAPYTSKHFNFSLFCRCMWIRYHWWWIQVI